MKKRDDDIDDDDEIKKFTTKIGRIGRLEEGKRRRSGEGNDDWMVFGF